MAQNGSSLTVGFSTISKKLSYAAFRDTDVNGSAGYVGRGKGLPPRRSRALAAVISAGLVGLLVLGACGEDDAEKENVAGSSAAGMNEAGSSAAGPGGAGDIAAGSGGAGESAAGSGGTQSLMDAAIADGSSAAGSAAAGTGAAGSAAAGTTTGGTSAVEDAGTTESGATDSGKTDTVRPTATSLSLPTIMETPGVAPYFNIYRPEDLEAAVAETAGLLPVIVWANGGCLRSAFTWEPLYKRWASAGFVVLAFDVGPDGNPIMMTSVDDQIALVDWALEEAQKQGSPYAGKLDTSRIVAAGNSCGGVTALGVAAKDERVAAVFVLSGSSALGTTDVNVMGAITVPVGYAEGGAEDISRAAATADYEALPEGIPAMIVARSTGDHMTISTDPTALAQEAEMSLNWLDLCLYGTHEAYDALTSPNICTGCEPGLWTLTSKNIEKLKK
ncbi:MAG: hypothetical protein JXA30_06490 [Deltaproteobacteria bacterium]|nr:hypothetical protein [Deltaproteobacteria bacterium]